MKSAPELDSRVTAATEAADRARQVIERLRDVLPADRADLRDEAAVALDSIWQIEAELLRLGAEEGRAKRFSSSVGVLLGITPPEPRPPRARGRLSREDDEAIRAA